MVRPRGTPFTFQWISAYLFVYLYVRLQVKYKAIDQKSRLVGNSLPALPLVITALASKPDVVGSAEARRQDPLLRTLRGRSTDHAPLAYYPEGTDLNAPGADRLIFYIPAIGYVRDCFSSVRFSLILTVIKYFRAGLFGQKSVTSTRIDSRSNGAKWGIDKEGITPASLACMFTIVGPRFITQISVY